MCVDGMECVGMFCSFGGKKLVFLFDLEMVVVFWIVGCCFFSVVFDFVGDIIWVLEGVEWFLIIVRLVLLLLFVRGVGWVVLIDVGWELGEFLGVGIDMMWVDCILDVCFNLLDLDVEEFFVMEIWVDVIIFVFLYLIFLFVELKLLVVVIGLLGDIVLDVIVILIVLWLLIEVVGLFFFSGEILFLLRVIVRWLLLIGCFCLLFVVGFFWVSCFCLIWEKNGLNLFLGWEFECFWDGVYMVLRVLGKVFVMEDGR